MRGMSKNEQSTWYSVYVICREYPEVGSFDDWVQWWSADSCLYHLVWFYAGSGGDNLALKSRVLELCDARESGRDRARQSSSPGTSWSVGLQYDIITNITMAAFYALRPFSLERVALSAGNDVPTKSSWHLATFNKKISALVAKELQWKWDVDDRSQTVRLENDALEGAMDLILTWATSGRLRWTDFSLDDEERRAVSEKALMLYRLGVRSVEQMAEDGVSTVARLQPPYSIWRR